jgi:hypothetical protein
MAELVTVPGSSAPSDVTLRGGLGSSTGSTQAVPGDEVSEAGSSVGHSHGGSRFIVAGLPTPRLDTVTPVLEMGPRDAPPRGRTLERSGATTPVALVFGSSAGSYQSCASHVGTAVASAPSAREDSVMVLVELLLLLLLRRSE